MLLDAEQYSVFLDLIEQCMVNQKIKDGGKS